MDFEMTECAKDVRERLLAFMDEHVYAAEPVYAQQLREAGTPHAHPPIMETLKAEARLQGLWNLFLCDEEHGVGLTNVEYAPLAEIMGRTRIAPEACNCSAPDTGNMQVLHAFGTAEQQQRWLRPLLDGEIRSGFAMTEPEVASSDATNIAMRIERDGDEYVLNGRKWWTTGALHPNCRVLVTMGKTDPQAAPYQQQSMVLVPLDTPGVTVERSTTVFGYTEPEGHGVLRYEDVRVPVENIIAGEGMGFLIARLLVMKTAWLMDTVGNQHARTEIAGIKFAVPQVCLRVVDRAIQVHGGGGVSDDFPLAMMYAGLRSLRLADGPDEVHKLSVARQELRRQRERRDAARP